MNNLIKSLFITLKSFPKDTRVYDDKYSYFVKRAKQNIREQVKRLTICDSLEGKTGFGLKRIGNLYRSELVNVVDGFYLKESVDLAIEKGDWNLLKNASYWLYFNGKFYPQSEVFIHNNELYETDKYFLYNGSVEKKEDLVKALNVPYWKRSSYSREEIERLEKEAEQYVRIEGEKRTFGFSCGKNVVFSFNNNSPIFNVEDSFVTSMFKYEGKRLVCRSWAFKFNWSDFRFLEFAPTKQHLDIIEKNNIAIKVRITLKNCTTSKTKFLKGLIDGKTVDYKDLPKIMEMIKLSLKGGKYE